MSKRSDPSAFARAAGAPDPIDLAALAPHPESAVVPAPEPPPAGALAASRPPGGLPSILVEEDDDSPTPYIDANGFDPADFTWVPVRRRARKDGFSEAKQRAFIEELADTGEVWRAAQQVGMSVQSCYRLRREPGGEPFAAAWDAAQRQAAHKLVELAFDRAINGSDEPVFDRDGRRVGRRMKPSDRMLMFLLRAYLPDRFRHAHESVRHPWQAPPPDTPAVSQALDLLEPTQPPEPHTLMTPEDLDSAVEVANMCAEAGEDLPPWHRSARPEPEWEPDEEFERRLEQAKAAACPAKARLAADHGDDDEGEDEA